VHISLTRGVHLIWTVDRGSDGPDLARAAGGSARSAATQDAAAARRRVAAHRGFSTGVHHSTRGSHRNVQKRTANNTVTSRDGEDDEGWRTAERRDSGAPARPTRRRGARERLQAALAAPLPCDGGMEVATRRREAAEALVNSGGVAKDGGGTDELGFGDGVQPRDLAVAYKGGAPRRAARGEAARTPSLGLPGAAGLRARRKKGGGLLLGWAGMEGWGRFSVFFLIPF
jgi:hypothetical protein